MLAPLQILLVEDDLSAARLVTAALAGVPSLPSALSPVARLGKALEMLEQRAFDAILLDLSLPDASGLEALARLVAAAPTTPIVVMSGNADEETAIAAVRVGAQDYLVKGNVTPDLLARAIRYAIERQQASVRLAHIAHHDALTGLPNRALFMDRATQALAQGRRHATPVAVLFVDLDGFKAVNDAHGHAVGDALLREVARRLAGNVREGDTVARLGGDEFTILLPSIAHEYDAAVVARRILESLAEPWAPDLAPLAVTTSIGINVVPDGAGDVESLLRDADAAMYRAKAAGKNRYAFRADEMTHQTDARIALDTELRQAITDNAFALRVQPVVTLPGERVLCAEALLDWPRPSGRIAHEQLFDLAEQTGVDGLLLAWALEHALPWAAAWRRAGFDIGVALNVTPSTLIDPETPVRVTGALARHAVPPDRLTLEVGESAVMRRREQSLAALTELSGLGVKLSLDGFGHGPSVLAYLKRLPLTEVKIDRALVGAMGTDDGHAAIVCALIGMIHALGLEAVANGVTDDAALALLGAVGCDAAQGSALGAPLPPEDLAAWLRARGISTT